VPAVDDVQQRGAGVDGGRRRPAAPHLEDLLELARDDDPERVAVPARGEVAVVVHDVLVALAVEERRDAGARQRDRDRPGRLRLARTTAQRQALHAPASRSGSGNRASSPAKKVAVVANAELTSWLSRASLMPACRS